MEECHKSGLENDVIGQKKAWKVVWEMLRIRTKRNNLSSQKDQFTGRNKNSRYYAANYKASKYIKKKTFKGKKSNRQSYNCTWIFYHIFFRNWQNK